MRYAGRVGKLLTTLVLIVLFIGLPLSAVVTNAQLERITYNDLTSKPYPGGYLDITISGFPGNVPVYIYLGQTLLTIMATDSIGIASGIVAIPDYITPGTYDLRAVYVNGTNTVSASTTVTIEPVPIAYVYNLVVDIPRYVSVGEDVQGYMVFVNVTNQSDPQVEDPDPLSYSCTYYDPQGNTGSLTLSKITTGIYTFQLTPSAEGSYLIQCSASKNSVNTIAVATVYASNLQNYILSNVTTLRTDILSAIQSNVTKIIDLINTSKSNITDLINSSTTRVLSKIKIGEDNITTLINQKTGEIIGVINTKTGEIINSLGDYADMIIKNITDSYNATNSTLANITELLRNLTILVNASYDNLTILIKAKATEILDTINSRHDATDNLIVQRTTWIINNITNAYDGLSVIISDSEANIIGIIRDKGASIESNLSDLINSSVSTIINAIEKVNGSILLAIADSRDQIIAYINETCVVKLANLTTLEHNLTRLINERYNGLADLINLARISLSQDIEDSRVALRSDIKESESNLTALLINESGVLQAVILDVQDVLSNKINALGNQVNARSQDILDAIELKASLLASLINSTNESLHLIITDRASEVLQAIGNLSITVETGNRNITILINATSGQMIRALNDKYESLYTLISTSNATIISAIGDLGSFVNGLIETAKRNLEENITVRIEASRDAILLEIGNSTQKILAAIASANSSLTALVQTEAGNIIGTVTTAIAQATQDVKEFINKSTDIVLNVTRAAELNLTVMVASSMNSVLAAINMTNASITRIILDSTGSLKALITNGTYAVLTELAKLNASLADLIGESTASLENTIDKVYMNITAKIEGERATLSGELVGVIDSRTSRLLDALSSSTNIVNGKIDEATIKIKRDVLNLTAYTQSMNATLQKIVETKTGELLAVINTTNQTLVLRLNGVSGQLEEFKQFVNMKFSETMSQLEDTKKAITDEVQKSAEEVKGVASNYGVGSTTASIITLLAVAGLALFVKKS